MKKIFIPAIAVIFTFISLCCEAKKSTSHYTDDFNVVWNSPSKNSLESMPVGGGDIGLNVWVENGDVLFYIGQSGTFDENNHMLKQGRVRLQLTPNPFTEYTKFSQTLNLKRGDLEIKSVNIANNVSILFWVDVFEPVIHIKIDGLKEMNVVAQYESWRFEDRVMSKEELFSCYTYKDYIDGKIVKSKDDIIAENGGVRWVHRTKDDKLARDFCINQQGLTAVKDRIYNPQKGRTFGGYMWGENLQNRGIVSGDYLKVPYRGYKISSEKARKSFALSIALKVGQFQSQQKWEESLNSVVDYAKKARKAKENSEKWWFDFWDRSHIVIGNNKSSVEWQIGRNYQLFRYMLACNSYGAYPSKFNGSLFTVDPSLINKKYNGIDADFRQWGGGSFTAQNQRLVYWPMVKSGDFDMMKPQFDFYKNALSSAEARTEHYWGHKGASFTEQLENFGLPIGAAWGFKSGLRRRDKSTEVGELSNRWISNHYVNQLEFSLMILEYYKYSGKSIEQYLPFIKSSILFFDKHYRYEYRRLTGKELDGDGKLVFFPSTAAEMYKIAKNPTDVISGLMSVVARMVELPLDYVSEDEKEYYKNLLSTIPPISLEDKDGHKIIKPAESWVYVANNEMPELYTLFPYGIYGIGKEGLDIAKNSWEYGYSNKKRSYLMSWSQVGIFAARLGLRKEAAELLIKRMRNSNRKFPAFWGPGVDWLPDFNHGGSCMIALQEMLMQTIDSENKIYLFPAWNKEWDVKFKMHAPLETIVEVELKGGKVVDLKVSPESRRNDVVVMLD